MQLNCAREDGDFKTLSSPVKSYKGPRIVAFLPLVSFTGCFDLGSLFYVQVAGKKSGTVSVPGQIFRELRFVFLRKHSHLEKRQKKTKNKNKKNKNKKKTKKKQAHTHVNGVVSKNNVDYSKRFLLSSPHEKLITGQELKRKK